MSICKDESEFIVQVRGSRQRVYADLLRRLYQNWPGSLPVLEELIAELAKADRLNQFLPQTEAEVGHTATPASSLVSVPQAAKHFRVSASRIRQRCRAKELAASKTRGQWWIDPKELVQDAAS
jgi:hypothetical protein